MQQIKYAQTAWSDIKNSPNWKKTVMLLALLQLIPIFGQIVLLGYAYGWARDIAWGVHAPLPKSIFANEDGKLYSRGFFILVILFVFSLVPGFISSVGGAFAGGGAGIWLNNWDNSPALVVATVGMVISLASMLLSFAVLLAVNIAGIRTAIYDRISAGFQLKKLWTMFRYDTKGALRILGMQLLLGFIVSLVIGVLIGLVSVICFGATLPGLIGLENTESEDILRVFGIIGPPLGMWMLFMLAVGFLGAVFSVIVQLMAARATGYWTQQFQVAQWRGQDDPMPFEAYQAQRAAQQAHYQAQAQYAQAQAQYAQAQAQQINYQHQQAQAQYEQAQQQAQVPHTMPPHVDSANEANQGN